MEFNRGSLGYVQSYERTRAFSCDPRLEISYEESRKEDIDRTSKKPLIKFCGRLAFGSSSARKYLRMWGNCFQ